MPKHAQKVRGNDQEGDKDEHLVIRNAIKRSLDFSSLVKPLRKDDKSSVEGAVRKIANKVYRAVKEYDGTVPVSDILAEIAKIRCDDRRLPGQLGLQRARQIFECTVGEARMLEPHIEYVSHNEQAAHPLTSALSAPASEADHDSPAPSVSGLESVEAEEISDPQSAASVANQSHGSLPLPVYLLEFARSPKQFYTALMDGPDLQPCRHALELERYSPLLHNGAKIFVHPEQYMDVLNAVKSLNLKARHVIIAADFEANMNDALRNICLGVCEKSRGTLPPAPAVVSRTFIEVHIASSLRSLPNQTVVVSTTDARPRCNGNPRRA